MENKSVEFQKNQLVFITDGCIPVNIRFPIEEEGYHLWGFDYKRIFKPDELQEPNLDLLNQLAGPQFPQYSKTFPAMGVFINANMKMRLISLEEKDQKLLIKRMLSPDPAKPVEVFKSSEAKSDVGYSLSPATQEGVNNASASTYATIIGNHVFDDANGRTALFAIYAQYYVSGYKFTRDPFELYALTTATLDSIDFDVNSPDNREVLKTYFSWIAEGCVDPLPEKGTPDDQSNYYGTIITDIASVSKNKPLFGENGQWFDKKQEGKKRLQQIKQGIKYV